MVAETMALRKNRCETHHLRQRGQKHRRQDSDDGEDHQKFEMRDLFSKRPEFRKNYFLPLSGGCY